MQIGFVNFNTEEKKRVAKMMQLLQESEAIEELGIGRVRDHFSNTLFPGTSTLQHHAKYFVLLPSLYYHAAYKSKKRFQGFAEVDRYIKEAEIQLTRQLSENADGSLKSGVTGITGINTYKNALSDYQKYVKYDPAYIYGTGIVRYGMVPDTNMVRLVLELNKKNSADPHNKRMLKSEDATEDAGDLTGEKQVIKTCGEAYDFFDGVTMEMSLTEKEATFLKDRINETCKGTLLTFLIECENDIPDNISYFDVEAILQGIDPDVLDVYRKSVLFSKLMYLIDWRFNYTYFDSFGKLDEAEACSEAYDELLVAYNDAIRDRAAYQSMFEHIRSIDMMLTEFCEKCYQAIVDGEPARVDELVKAREYTVKRERSKIGNRAYRDQGRGNPLPNSFRWESVRMMVNEIRNPQ